MDSIIKKVDGHYEVWIEGQFYCSADTYGEANTDRINLMANLKAEQST